MVQPDLSGLSLATYSVCRDKVKFSQRNRPIEVEVYNRGVTEQKV